MLKFPQRPGKCILSVLAGSILFCSCTTQPPKQQSGQLPSSQDTVVMQAKHTDTASAPRDSKTIPADQLLVPGKSAGLTHIGDDMVEIIKRLGKPDAGDAAMGRSMSFWYAGHDSTRNKTAIFAGRSMGNADENVSRVQQILITSPYFKTADKVQIGISYRQAEINYDLKNVTTIGKGQKQLTVYDDKERGIAFEFSPDRLCKGIIIHAAGKDGGVAYLAFHPELERASK